MTGAGHTGSDSEDIQREASDWVLRVTSGHASKADIAALEVWCAQSSLHAEAFSRASLKWRSLGPVLESMAAEASVARMTTNAGQPRSIGRRAFLGGAMAASAVGAAIVIARPPFELWPSPRELTADYRTAAGEQRRLELTSDISVEMNTRTSLNVQPDLSSGRIELIAGEASIMTRDRPVELAAGRGMTRFENAHVNIRQEGDEARVSCLTGNARITWNGRLIDLSAGKQITYGNQTIGSLANADFEAISGWLHGDIFFRNEPLSHVISELNRYRSGRIILANRALGERRFTARFKSDRLDAVLSQLEAVLGAKITRLPGGVVLVS
jgi:transmembrane sensor